MEWMKSIAEKFKRNLRLPFISSQNRQNAFIERSILWFNSFYLYSKKQPILCLTCLILFLSLVLMLLIYRYRKRNSYSISTDRKRLEETTTSIQKQLKKTQIKKSDQEESSESNQLIDYDHHQYTTKDQKQQNNQNDQIKQFKNNKMRLISNGPNYEGNQKKINEQRNDKTERQLNEKLNYGNKLERAKCQNEGRKIEFTNSRLNNLKGKFDEQYLKNGHFCIKTNCCDEFDDKIDKRFHDKTKHYKDNQTKGFNQLNNQSKPIEKYRDKLFEQCCCCHCPCFERSKMKKREIMNQKLKTEFCDCKFCSDTQNRQTDLQINDDAQTTSSFDTCDQENCRRRCKISELIEDNVSSRCSSNDDSSINQLFDNKYRKKIKLKREKDKLIHKYDSWSSHLHISSPVN